MIQSFEEMSRLEWRPRDESFNNDFVVTGCLQRIATALEKIHKLLASDRPQKEESLSPEDARRRSVYNEACNAYFDMQSRCRRLASIAINSLLPKGSEPQAAGWLAEWFVRANIQDSYPKTQDTEASWLEFIDVASQRYTQPKDITYERMIAMEQAIYNRKNRGKPSKHFPLLEVVMRAIRPSELT